ncbi:pyridoxal-phosphate dependent enzyme [Streptomyces sp. NPDC014983]|uniref:pyridoxal-phosphate dependent enzyme n=1 Tax=Streptomyces sp. NPDC014983 TaxID=3364933 RepID=UPI0036F6AD4F
MGTQDPAAAARPPAPVDAGGGTARHPALKLECLRPTGSDARPGGSPPRGRRRRPVRHRPVAAGRRVPGDAGATVAGGPAGDVEPGPPTVGLGARYVDGLVTVTGTEIRRALRCLAAGRGHVTEGSGAVPVAALLAAKVPSFGRTVAVVSGRGIALPVLASVLARPRPEKTSRPRGEDVRP